MPSPLSTGNGKTPPRSKPSTPLSAYDMGQFNNNQQKTVSHKGNPFFSKFAKPSYQ